MRRTTALALLATAALALGGVGCGGDDEDGGTAGTPAPAATQPAATEPQGGSGDTASQGRTIFTERCASCHALADAGADGSVGPSLDETTLDTAAIAEQVRNGGGSMPPFEGTLEDAEIQAVSEYVAGAAGG